MTSHPICFCDVLFSCDDSHLFPNQINGNVTEFVCRQPLFGELAKRVNSMLQEHVVTDTEKNFLFEFLVTIRCVFITRQQSL